MERSGCSVGAVAFVICLAFTGLNGVRVCNKAVYDDVVHKHCIPLYKQRMARSNYQTECPWPTTKDHYVQLDECVRRAGNLTRCTEASLKSEFFLELHRTYFSLCFFMQDPDVSVVLLLALPCIISTFLFPCCCAHLTSTTFLFH